MVTRKELFRWLAGILNPIYGDKEATQLTYLILEHFCQCSKKDLMTDPSLALLPQQVSAVRRASRRLLNHEPVQYILGHALFYGRKFRVNRHVLIPRPETEELVSWIIGNHQDASELHILDIGTGSGCIAISLNLGIRGSRVVALDSSRKALAVARKNAAQLGAPVKFLYGNILESKVLLSESFDVIVSNPPYIPLTQQESVAPNVLGFEPAEALFVPGDDPLLFYRNILSLSKKHLAAEGMIYFETHEAFNDRVVELCHTAGYGQVTARNDIHGKPRMVCCRMN